MRQYQIPTNFFSALQFTQVRKRHERRVNARARENEDHIYMAPLIQGQIDPDRTWASISSYLALSPSLSAEPDGGTVRIVTVTEDPPR